MQVYWFIYLFTTKAGKRNHLVAKHEEPHLQMRCLSAVCAKAAQRNLHQPCHTQSPLGEGIYRSLWIQAEELPGDSRLVFEFLWNWPAVWHNNKIVDPEAQSTHGPIRNSRWVGLRSRPPVQVPWVLQFCWELRIQAHTYESLSPSVQRDGRICCKACQESCIKCWGHKERSILHPTGLQEHSSGRPGHQPCPATNEQTHQEHHANIIGPRNCLRRTQENQKETSVTTEELQQRSKSPGPFKRWWPCPHATSCFKWSHVEESQCYP